MTGLLLVALLLGGLIGWERERLGRPAGLRTHILVCVGAALITLVSNAAPSSGGRIAAQIVTGVGFLGAGTILRDGTGAVSGLTTAASLWAVAGVGIAVGYGGRYAALAAVATGLMLFTLSLLNRFEDALIRRRRRHALTVLLAGSGDPLGAVGRLLDLLHAQGVKTRDLRLERMADAEAARLEVTLPRYVRRDALDAVLGGSPDVVHHEWGD
jgi:putative Mg2+ transporter-C (MgtC) family protein